MLKQNRQTFLICIYFFTIATTVFSQKTTPFYVPDSLKNLSYKELYKKYMNCSPNETLIDLYSNAYLNKAKNEKDTLRIANGYTQVGSTKSIELIVKYLDSIILITKNKNYHDYPAFGYLWKGDIQFETGQYDDALENLLFAQKYASKNNNIQQLLTVKLQIGSIKLLWGDKNEAIDCFKYVIQNFNHPDIPENYKMVKQEAYRHLSYCFSYKKQYDSAYFYVKKYLNTPFKFKNKLHVQTAHDELIAEIELHQKNYSKSLDLLLKIKKRDTLSLILNNFNLNYLLGSSYNKLQKKDSAFYYFSKADSIYIATNDLMPETRKVKEFFINYYKKNNNIEKQLVYIGQLLKVDSLINNNTKTLNNKIKKEYDEPQLLAEKQQIIEELSSKSVKNYFLIVTLVSLGVLSSLAFYFYYRQQQKLKNKLDLYKKTPIKKVLHIENLPTDVVKQINRKLVEFENNYLFTQNNLTLAKLAKQLDTNSNYLSKIVNQTKGKNFSTYISDLRIDYCLNKLQKDSTFRKYSIKAIAIEIGFNNTESFSKAFFSKTNEYPSNYIKNLDEL